MLANFLNKSKPINFIGLLVFFFINFFLLLFLDFYNVGFSTNLLVERLIFALIFLVIFFLINFVVAKNKLTFDNSYAFFFFIILSILILNEVMDLKILLLQVVYLLFLRKIYSLRSQKKIIEKVYDASFWLGIFFIVEPKFIILLFLQYLAIYLHKRLTINTLIIPVLGFCTPLLVYFSYLFWYDNVDTFLALFDFQFHFSLSNISDSKFYIPFLIVGFAVFISIVLKSSTALTVSNSFKRNWILLIVNLLLTLFFLSAKKTIALGEFMYLFFPIAIIIANGIEMIPKNSYKNIILYLFLAGSIAVQFFL